MLINEWLDLDVHVILPLAASVLAAADVGYLWQVSGPQTGVYMQDKNAGLVHNR